MTRTVPHALRTLARAHGIQTSYADIGRVRRFATPDAIELVLRALGAPLHSAADASDALRQYEADRARARIEPVHVAWDGELPPLRGHLPETTVECRLVLETGAVRAWSGRLRKAQAAGAAPAWRAGLPRTIPIGYHALEMSAGHARFDTTIIAAPRHAFVPARPRSWGLFLPLYAARPAHGRAAADYTDLEAFSRWTGTLGGEFFGTLPLLPTFLGAPFEPSPYAPVSRLFWSDFFIDTDRLPGEDARAADSPERQRIQDQLARAGADERLDYRLIGQLKRRIIDEAAQRFFLARGEQDPAFDAYLARTPWARDYARFRAVGERREQGWPAWPDRLREGAVRPEDFDISAERYHLYAAWVADTQIAAVAAARDEGAAGLYLDLPLGVHRHGYDAWRFNHLFAAGVSAGSPPDPFFTEGQNWGFAPLHPAATRADAHRYTLQCLRHHMRHASALRIDHVMSLQRLFWIPDGMDARHGVYVRYPLEELVALLTLESVRSRTVVVGEDLGTVSREVRTALGRHRVQRMFVFQFEATPTRPLPTADVRRSAVASLNTHDMPTFAAYWHALDLEDRQRLGHLSAEQAAAEAEERARLRARIVQELGLCTHETPGAGMVLGPLLESLARCRARILLVNLEDLWLETRPQNVPGTSYERPNWRRRARMSLEQIRHDQNVLALLRRIAELRHNGQDHG